MIDLANKKRAGNRARNLAKPGLGLKADCKGKAKFPGMRNGTAFGHETTRDGTGSRRTQLQL
jgi:hypothetical protein